MTYADEILDYSGQRKTGVTAGSYGPASDVSPEAGGTIAVPQLTVNEKGLITGAVERTVTFPYGGGGGGGGGEEQFQKVYETTLVEASESDTITITTADMDGAYVDVVVYAAIPGDSNNDTFAVDYLSSSDDYIGDGSASLEENGITFAHFALSSFGGLALLLQDWSQYNSGESENYTGFSYEQMEYPTQGIAGVASIILSVGGLGATHVFPIGTTITVYARRKVTPNAQA